MLSMNLCLFKRNKAHGIEGTFNKMDEPQPATQRYQGASHTTTLSWDTLAQTSKMKEYV